MQTPTKEITLTPYGMTDFKHRRKQFIIAVISEDDVAWFGFRLADVPESGAQPSKYYFSKRAYEAIGTPRKLKAVR